MTKDLRLKTVTDQGKKEQQNFEDTITIALSFVGQNDRAVMVHALRELFAEEHINVTNVRACPVGDLILQYEESNLVMEVERLSKD